MGKREKIKDYFNSIAATYCNNFDRSIIGLMMDDIALSVDSVVYEVGSGSCDFTQFILERIGKRGMVWCVEIAEEMIKIAKTKVNDSRVVFVVGEIFEVATSVPKPDAIVCFNMYPHIARKNEFIKKCYAMLSKNGILAICHDATRARIEESHIRNMVDPQIADFPSTFQTTQMMLEANFKIEKTVEAPYYLIKAVK